MSRINGSQSRAIFGNPSPPSQVTEHQFDGFDDHLHRVAQTPWDQIKDEDLWYYIHDLAYVELQPDLFNYLFPVCLNFWYQSLMRSQACAQGDAEFHYALSRGQILEKHVSPDQRNQIYRFFHDGFLDRLDQERGFVYHAQQTPAYGWMMRLNSLGLVVPLIEPIWNDWWSISSPGQAVSALMYLSGLMYPIGENPIFKAWNPKKGGGGPYLWENDSYIFHQGWLPENLAFFRQTLTVDYFRQKAQDACQRLTHEPESQMAEQICTEYTGLSWAVEIRVEYLLERLEQSNRVYMDW